MSEPFEDRVGRVLARLEEDTPEAWVRWLGGIKGVLLGVGLALVTAALLPVGFASRRLGVMGWFLLVGVNAAFWKRQRLAAHFDRSVVLLDNENPEVRNRGLVELMTNARRGGGEHRRIARALLTLMEVSEPEDANRKLARTILTDGTLPMKATAGLSVPD